jgi:hypothetical protein
MSAARCAARRYPAGWQAHGALPVGVSFIGVERHLLSLVSQTNVSFCSTNGNFSSWYQAGNALVMWQARRYSIEVAGPAVSS